MRRPITTGAVLAAAFYAGLPDAARAAQPPAYGEAPDLAAEVAERVARSVVLLERQEQDGGNHFAPNGFVIGRDLVVTSNHSVEGCERLWVNLGPGGIYEVRGVVAADEAHDVAILAVDLPDDLPTLDLAGALPARGAPVAMVARHHETGDVHVRTGRRERLSFEPYSGVDMVGVSVEGWPGCSGAPLVDHGGLVLGVVSSGRDGDEPRIRVTPAASILALEHAEPVPIGDWAERCGWPREAVYGKLIVQGYHAVGEFDYGEAVKHFERALAIAPRRTRVALALASALQYDGRPEESEVVLRSIIEQEPEHAGAWLLLGLSQHRGRRVDEATVSYRKSIAIRPSAEACYWLAMAIVYKGGDVEEAIEILSRATALEPDHPYAATMLATLCMKHKKGQELARASRVVLRSDSLDPNVLMGLAGALRELKQDEAEREVISALEKVNPFVANRARTVTIDWSVWLRETDETQDAPAPNGQEDDPEGDGDD